MPEGNANGLVEVLGFVDKRVLKHGDTAALEYFGAYNGESWEGELVFKLAGLKERAADSPHLHALDTVEPGTEFLTGNASVLIEVIGLLLTR